MTRIRSKTNSETNVEGTSSIISNILKTENVNILLNEHRRGNDESEHETLILLC